MDRQVGWILNVRGFVFALLFLFSPLCLFALPVGLLSREEFKQIALELAPKVNLFAAVWREDPNAIFYGGTSRDFLYWVLGQFKDVESENELDLKREELKKVSLIDIRRILGHESDADIITSKHLSIEPDRFGIRKIDSIDSQRLDPDSALGKNEIDQGFIPIEKIELSQTDIYTPESFGDGVGEILSGDLSVQFSSEEKFWNSHYAKLKLNHPVFLAIRYLRLLAMHWYHKEGSGAPNRKKLLSFNPQIKSQIEKIFKEALRDRRFKEVLEQKQALRWLNGCILKSFRSYTNQTAAYLLFNDLGFKDLQAAFPKIESINQFLFQQYRNHELLRKAYEEFSITSEELFTPVQSLLRNLKLYHGTRTEEAFRAILFQNAMPSQSGSAGAGLYAVDSASIDFAENWAGSPDRVVVFDISLDAKAIDITQGIGKRIFEEWKKRTGKRSYDLFAAYFGADILKYDYTPKAYVVKNSSVLLGRQGLYRRLLTVDQLEDFAKRLTTGEDIESFFRALFWSGLAREEVENIYSLMPSEKINEWAPSHNFLKSAFSDLIPLLFKTGHADLIATVLLDRSNEWDVSHLDLFLPFGKGTYSPLSLKEQIVLGHIICKYRIKPFIFISYYFSQFFDESVENLFLEWMSSFVERGDVDSDLAKGLASATSDRGNKWNISYKVEDYIRFAKSDRYTSARHAITVNDQRLISWIFESLKRQSFQDAIFKLNFFVPEWRGATRFVRMAMESEGYKEWMMRLARENDFSLRSLQHLTALVRPRIGTELLEPQKIWMRELFKNQKLSQAPYEFVVELALFVVNSNFVEPDAILFVINAVRTHSLRAHLFISYINRNAKYLIDLNLAEGIRFPVKACSKYLLKLADEIHDQMNQKEKGLRSKTH